MARFSEEFLMELRMRCDIEQIISMYTQLKKRGKNLVGLCPFHGEKTPSFTVYPENQSFYCFGCAAGGEVISFIRRAENLDYVEAVRFLCDKCGMAMPSEGYDNSLSEKRRRMYEINREAAKFFNKTLFEPEGAAGLEYFRQRGLKKSTITHFGLGYAPDSWDALLRYMRGKGYSYEELYEANLAYKSTKTDKVRFFDAFRNRVMVPIIDVRGNVVAFGGRVLDDSKPKYINTSDTLVYKKSLGVFGLNFAKSSGEKNLILVEGYMDAISLHQAGFTNVIACLGTAFTTEMAQLLSRYADELLLCYDSDEAGQKATNRAISVLGSMGMKLRVIKLEGGKDPDEILKKYGPERFRSAIEGAANDIEFELVRLREGLDLSTSDGKMKYLELASEALAATGNKIAQDIYSSRLSQELSVSKDTILTRIGQIERKRKTARERSRFRQIQQNAMSENAKLSISTSTGTKSIKAQEMLIACIAKNPDFLRYICEDISSADFTVPVYSEIFSVIAGRIGEHSSTELTMLADEMTPEVMATFVKICKSHEALAFTQKTCMDCVATIKAEQSRKQEKSVPVSDMSDEDFCARFKKKKKDS